MEDELCCIPDFGDALYAGGIRLYHEHAMFVDLCVWASCVVPRVQYHEPTSVSF